jgi:hypothetical protein
MTSRSKDIIFLLGAGASAEAGIPVSSDMIQRLEDHLRERHEWKEFRPLYNHVKSAIHFSAGLKGHFRDDVPFNIETLVNTLYELERNEEHPLYPFIAAWNSRFVALAGPDFGAVRRFRQLILGWLCSRVSRKGERRHRCAEPGCGRKAAIAISVGRSGPLCPRAPESGSTVPVGSRRAPGAVW